jgi:hypothetical protein
MSWPKSTSEARRLMRQGAVRIDGVKVPIEMAMAVITLERPCIVQCGKRTFGLVLPPGYTKDKKTARAEADAGMHTDTGECKCWKCTGQGLTLNE